MRAVEEVYRPLLDEYISELSRHPKSDYVSIPSPFLPQIGRNYDHALIRIAFVGKETYGWGGKDGLARLIRDYSAHGYNFAAGMADFQNLGFKGWKNGRTFWAFWMRVLAEVYGVADWHQVKEGKFDVLLDSFVWGNANAVETLESQTFKDDNVSPSGYNRAKRLAEKKFDKIDLLIKATRPHAIVLVCEKCNDYLGSEFKEIDSINNGRNGKIRVLRRGDTGTIVFHAPHPRYQQTSASGNSKWYVHEFRKLLENYGLFCPLPNVYGNGLSPKSKDLLIKECDSRCNTKFEAIAKVAHELRKQHSLMTARSLCTDILNHARHRTQRDTLFTGNGRGPCRLVKTAWDHFQNVEKRGDIAEDIALSFVRTNGRYAYL